MKRALFSTPQEVETAFYEAFEKGDLEAMMSVWADDDDIVCVHPGGQRLAGAEQIRSMAPDFRRRPGVAISAARATGRQRHDAGSPQHL